jgi:hypothetical protein
MRRAARSDRDRAWPPSDAIRFLSAADRRRLRAFPPLRPNTLAISDAFMTVLYLTLSIFQRSPSLLPLDPRAPGEAQALQKGTARLAACSQPPTC